MFLIKVIKVKIYINIRYEYKHLFYYLKQTFAVLKKTKYCFMCFEVNFESQTSIVIYLLMYLLQKFILYSVHSTSVLSVCCAVDRVSFMHEAVGSMCDRISVSSESISSSLSLSLPPVYLPISVPLSIPLSLSPVYLPIPCPPVYLPISVPLSISLSLSPCLSPYLFHPVYLPISFTLSISLSNRHGLVSCYKNFSLANLSITSELISSELLQTSSFIKTWSL